MTTMLVRLFLTPVLALLLVGAAASSALSATDPTGLRGTRPLAVPLALPSVLSSVEPAPAPAGAVWPLDPRPAVVGAFDPPTSSYGAGHRGVDLAGRPGQEVRAAAAGRVTYAGSLAGRGVVVVEHGATRTTYEPVRAVVAVGDLVAAGSPLGTLDSTGSHCAPATCLHWGYLQGTTYLDPLRLVGAGPVRLLPLFGPPGSPVGGILAAALTLTGRSRQPPSPAALALIARPA